MAFSITYYITLCSPFIEDSLRKIDNYVDHGMQSLQIDMPSLFPTFETPLVKSYMEKALGIYKGYSSYMDAIKTIHFRYPQLDLNLVVYPDVIENIGRDEFISFIKSAGIHTVMIAGGNKELSNFLREHIEVIGRIDRNLIDEELAETAKYPAASLFNFNYKRHSEIAPHGCRTFKEKIDYIRKAGVKCKIIAVEGVSTVEKLDEVKMAGCDGVLVGNVFMNLWSDENKLWKLFKAFQSFSEN